MDCARHPAARQIVCNRIERIEYGDDRNAEAFGNSSQGLLHALRAIAGDDRKLFDAPGSEGLNLPFNQSLAPDVKEGLGNFRGQWQKPFALARCKNNYTHNA